MSARSNINTNTARSSVEHSARRHPTTTEGSAMESSEDERYAGLTDDDLERQIMAAMK